VNRRVYNIRVGVSPFSFRVLQLANSFGNPGRKFS
jgi:hypothetical protein